jgi:hypothetical protein
MGVRALIVFSLALVGLLPRVQASQSAPASMVYPAGGGPGAGRHIVFLAGDEEYRGEEALPMLAKILSQRHGFRTTVLFPLDQDGTINPKNQRSLPGSEALDSADLIVMLLRFRQWPDADMARFERAYLSGTPIVALRTSTHAFAGFPADSPWARWNYNNNGGFGKQVLGETWVTHWGRHKVEATRGVVEPEHRTHALLRGITGLFGDSDVYEAYPPADAEVLVRGLVLQTLALDAAPADYRKRRASDKVEQSVNDPAMPVVWTRQHRNERGNVNRVLTTTLGAATDLQDENLRRLVVNGVYWGLGIDVPARADVRYVDPYDPSFYGFDGFRQGLRVADFALGATVPGTPLARPQPPPVPAP